jgi:hypothetical protein
MYVGTGSVTTPSISTWNDTNTGIYFPADDNLAFVEGGVEVLRIDSNGRVGIGTQTPSSKLEVEGSLSVSGSVNLAGSVNMFGNLNAYNAINLAGSNNSTFSLGLNRKMGDMFFGPILTTGSIIIGSPTQSSSLIFGRSTNSHTVSIAVGTVSFGLQKIVEIGTNGESGSFTVINIGSSTLGALGTISMNENTIFNANVGIATQTPSAKLEVLGAISATSFISNISTGTAPFTVSSTTLVTNLNADFLDGQHGAYYLDYTNLNNKPTISDALVIITAGAGLTGTGTFSLNQYNPLIPESGLYPSLDLLPGSADNINLSFSHADTSNISTLTASSNIYVSGLVFDDFGHVTALTTASQTASAANDGLLTMTVSGIGLSGSSTFSANQSANSTFTVSSNATSSNVNNTIVSRDSAGSFAATTVSANLVGTASNATSLNNQTASYYLNYTNLTNKPTISDSVITITSGGGLTGSGTFSLNQGTVSTITLSHLDTSNVSTLTATSRTYVTGLTFDTYGHVTALTTATETASTGVTSVAFSGGTTGLTVTGSPITTAGTITLSGTLGVANGGTGVTSSTGTGSVVLNSSPTFTGNIDFINGNLRVYKTTDLGAPFTSSGAIISIGDSTSEIDMSGGIAFVENLDDTPNGVTMGMFYAGISNKFHIVGLAGGGSTVAANMTNAPRYVTILRSNGDMGIGTQTPSTKLEVVGTISGSNLFTNRITASSITVTNIFATTLTASSVNITGNVSASILYVGTGSVTTPSISTWTDTNTGIFFPAADTIAIGEGGAEVIRINSSGNVGIGTRTPSYKLEVLGDFAATTKSFIIPHPLDSGRRLRYSSLEGPENGVYIRGRTTSSVILLPDYFEKLVHEDSITVHLNAIGSSSLPKIKSVGIKEIILQPRWWGKINCYYIVFAERRDVPRLEVEI